MIRDAHHSLLSPAWSRYVHWRLRRGFRGVWVRGALPADEPILLYANHSNFWDGFVAHAVVASARRDGYAMMEEQNLARHRFLRRLGAFSIRRGSAGSARETLRYAASLLTRPKATVLVFPQGQFEAGPELHLERGVEVLARKTGVRCVPMAIRYGLFEHEYPDVLVSLGEAHAPESIHAMATRLERQRAWLAAVQRPDALAPLLTGRRSVAESTLSLSRPLERRTA